MPDDITANDGLASAIAGMTLVMHKAGVYEYVGDSAQRECMQRANVQAPTTCAAQC